MHDMPEPCQWMPLDGMCDATRMTSTTIWTTMRTTTVAGEASGILPTWTEGLHEVAMLVMSILGIHQNVALSDGECRCRDDDDRYRRCRRTNVPNVDDAACDDNEDDDDNVVKRRR